jgi:NAD(P)-dependent dehydrogenase (short-subunit alcohol dehydrogenase family)
MTTAVTAAPTRREPALLGQTVVVIGGSSGVGLETARRARAEGAALILTGLQSDALQRAALELDALSAAAFDANDPAALEQFFAGLPTPIDHVMVTAGRPHYGRLLESSIDELRDALGDRALLAVEVARNAAGKVRPGGTLLFISASQGSRPTVGTGSVSTVAAALPALIASLALETAPVRAEPVKPGETPCVRN